ncbi:pentapeptide repeat family protein [Caulobacter phage BL94]|nr:pentapeptide repeat family protein [Caulobacter phage BL94]
MTKVTEKVEVRNRWSNEIQFTAEITCAPDATPSVKLGLAIRWGVKNGANLYGANLTRANLYGANLDGANLTRANLDGANLDGANLDGANLDGANLYGANLYGANLYGANLTRANLYGANLDGANLTRANLDGANLDGANLDGANLYGANLDGANLYGAKLAENITLSRAPLQLYGLTWPVTIFDRHMKIGCQFHSLHAWENFSDREIIAMDGRSAAKFWASHKATLLALARADSRSFEPDTNGEAQEPEAAQ